MQLLLAGLHHGDHSQVLDGVYNPRPRADVKDAACLASGRDAGRIEKGKAKLGNITFDDEDHITKLKRGEKLRCTELPQRHRRGGAASSRGRTPRSIRPVSSCATSRDQRGTGPGRLPGVPRDADKVVEHQRLHVLARVVPEARRAVKQCRHPGVRGSGKVETPIAGRLPRRFGSEEGRRAGDPSHSMLDLQRDRVFKCHERVRHGQVELVKTFEVECDGCQKRLHNYQKESTWGRGRGGPRYPVTDVSAQVSCNGCQHPVVEVKESRVRSPPRASERRSGRAACVRREANDPMPTTGSGIAQPGRRHGADCGREAAVGSGATTDKKLSQAEGARRGRAGEPRFLPAVAGRTTSTPSDRSGSASSR